MKKKRTTQAADRQQTEFRMKENIVTLLLGVTVILVVMNTMMFNLALPTVTEQFGLSTTTASWIVTGYSIVFAISSITYSRLSDYLPIRTLLITGLLSFGLASLLGLFSGNFALLLVARLIQASGAASIPALGIMLVTRFIPTERRGKAMSVIMSASSLGLGLGPVIGGAITEYLGWHELFIVSAASLAVIPFFLRLLPREKSKTVSFDISGAVCLGIGTTGLLLYMTNRSWLALIAGGISILLFWLRIRSAGNPFVQPDLFGNKRYMTLSFLGIAAYMCSFCSLFLLPQLLARSYGLTPGEAGLIIFPGALVSMLISRKIGGIIDLHGNRLLFRYAPWILVAAALLFAILADWSMYAVMVAYMLLSTGFSSLTTGVSNELSRILPQPSVGAGMGLFQLLQFFSGAFSVAVTGSVLTSFQTVSPGKVYAGIFWGMAAVAAIAVACALLYAVMEAFRQKRESGSESKPAVLD
ncbi:MFS transporter [Paenibacillus protaetiae]|uniref:MFS transporter n=1 Tax=Paenibacillus protaetiae TaxID=2509456 RepID=A0A4P6F806_9BACL|nr:MFS transporter [Paenibacillus protaetiae]QAY66568.1 MFS transporter [Paenibacillus protaetiae]